MLIEHCSIKIARAEAHEEAQRHWAPLAAAVKPDYLKARARKKFGRAVSRVAVKVVGNCANEACVYEYMHSGESNRGSMSAETPKVHSKIAIPRVRRHA